ncbi:MAG: sulfotransferase [Myxococcales bacterium]
MTETPQALRPGFPFSWVNRLDPFRKALIPINAQSAKKLAERLTGLHDYGDDGFLERLDAAVSSIQEIDLSTTGRFGARYVLNWHLTNKLRVVDVAKRHPEVREIPIERPLVITGLFRTGTTFLHALLAADPDNRAGRAWELFEPVGRRHDPFGDEAHRRRRAGLTIGLNHSFIPDQDVVHHVTPDAYEECLFLLQDDMASLTIFAAWGTWSYARQMLDWDMRIPYRNHKLQLQMLTKFKAGKRWQLKCPWHLWNLDALLAVYPDARIIQTHRDVAKSLGSQCSLSARMIAKMQRSMRMSEVGDFWLDYSRIGIDRGMAARRKIPDSQIYDLRLDDLLAHPIDVLKEIYAHFDLEFEPGLSERFLARIAQQPTAQLGDHDYDIEDFGLTEARVREHFRDYCELFGV